MAIKIGEIANMSVDAIINTIKGYKESEAIDKELFIQFVVTMSDNEKLEKVMPEIRKILNKVSN